MNSSNPEDNSKIPQLHIPEGGFKADIPDALLQDCSEKDRYLYETLGSMKHYIDWSSKVLIDSNFESRKTNGRVLKNEADISILESQIKSWIGFKEGFVKFIKNRYTIITIGFLIFVALFPLVSWINATGGLVKFIENIIKFFAP